MRRHGYLSFLAMIIFCGSCGSQPNAPMPKDSAHDPQSITDQGLGLPKTTEEMDASLAAGIDPYFVEPEDTISTRGPQCIVRDLIQDKMGNIWLATWQGIIRYDGHVFVNYTLREGLIHFHVGSLFEDSKGSLWFGMTRGGVYRYDGHTFKLFTTIDGLADNTVYSIAEDGSGNIWLGTEHGVSRYDGIVFKSYTVRDGLPDDYVNAVIKDKSGIMWFGTNKGICRYDGKTFSAMKDLASLSVQKVGSLYEDRDGNIWIGTGAQQAGGLGLCMYNGTTLTPLVNPYYVMYMCEDKKGNLWLAHNKGTGDVYFGLYRYDGKSFTNITKQDQPDNPVIFGILEDHQGNIWYGTAKGVWRYDGDEFDYYRN